jgi:hypothetical protein
MYTASRSNYCDIALLEGRRCLVLLVRLSLQGETKYLNQNFLKLKFILDPISSTDRNSFSLVTYRPSSSVKIIDKWRTNSIHVLLPRETPRKGWRERCTILFNERFNSDSH